MPYLTISYRILYLVTGHSEVWIDLLFPVPISLSRDPSTRFGAVLPGARAIFIEPKTSSRYWQAIVIAILQGNEMQPTIVWQWCKMMPKDVEWKSTLSKARNNNSKLRHTAWWPISIHCSGVRMSYSVLSKSSNVSLSQCGHKSLALAHRKHAKIIET